MKKILFATNNAHKVREANYICAGMFEFEDLESRDIIVSIPETGDSFQENALQKARFIYDEYGFDCMSEDSGLEVEALNGAPGIYSARYAGEHANHAKNIALLLKNMNGVSERTAQFKAVIALIIDGDEYLFEGVCPGHIAYEAMGSGGFGYDPVFIPEGFRESFAQLGDDIKSGISHRKKALEQLIAFFINSK